MNNATETTRVIKITRELAEHIIYTAFTKDDGYCRYVERAFYSWSKTEFQSIHELKIALSTLDNNQIETLLLRIE